MRDVLIKIERGLHSGHSLLALWSSDRNSKAVIGIIPFFQVGNFQVNCSKVSSKWRDLFSLTCLYGGKAIGSGSRWIRRRGSGHLLTRTYFAAKRHGRNVVIPVCMRERDIGSPLRKKKTKTEGKKQC